ncbi:MAG: metallophosphoesterase, partial [Oscillibacter sp.]|nr:metallophosphoesterase [Oscillibacter sp.]
MKWLHISDLHIDSSYKSKRGENWFYFAIPPARGDFFGSFFRGLNARVSKKKVDFIVFTGDLFNHGQWDEGQKDAAVQFLEDVYRVCAEASGWREWKRGEQMERLFYCPGNHDVFRSAYHIEDDSYVTLRSNLLDSIVKGGTPVAPEDGYFCAETANNSVERQVLMDKTFSLFDNAMRNCGKYQSGNHGEFRYEFRQFILPKDIQLKSAVVGLNTALLAGRPYSQDDITEALMDTWDKFQRAHAKFDFEAAREAYNEYQDAYKKQLGLIKDDKEHLCFISHSAATALTNTLVFGGYQYPILFGHHPISFYSEEAKRAFLNFADAVHAQVYLCGHTHKPEVNSIYHGARMNWQRILEITLGG